jgi:hypothetical protein
MARTIPEKSRRLRSSPAFWPVVIAAVAFIERLLVILLYQPVSYGDTPSYRRLADSVLAGFASYDGTRTPGYPVFLAITGNDQKAWLVQLLLGFITTLLLFYLGWKLTGKAWLGVTIALAHTLNLSQLFFESNLLTESLTTFLMVLTMAGVFIWLVQPRTRTVWLAFGLGLISTLTLLVRPLFIYLPFLLLLFLLLIFLKNSKIAGFVKEKNAEEEKIKVHQRSIWSAGIALLLPVALLLGGWVTFIHARFNEWSLTTMTGYHLVQHTGNFFEYVPDEYASVRDTYIKYRDAQIAENGNQTNAIWDAIPEMSQVSGYSFYALSRVLTHISIDLILQHPFLYLKNAISGWWMFWRVPVYWSADALRFAWLGVGLTPIILIERVGIFFINILFIAFSLLFMINEMISSIRRKPPRFQLRSTNPVVYRFSWLLLANIWVASILQTLLDHGDNPRFLVPMQSLVILWVAVFVYQFITQNPIKLAPKPHSPSI